MEGLRITSSVDICFFFDLMKFWEIIKFGHRGISILPPSNEIFVKNAAYRLCSHYLFIKSRSRKSMREYIINISLLGGRIAQLEVPSCTNFQIPQIPIPIKKNVGQPFG